MTIIGVIIQEFPSAEGDYHFGRLLNSIWIGYFQKLLALS